MVPTVPFKMLAKGYKVTASMREGYKAEVPFLVKWSDAYLFVAQALGQVNPPAARPTGAGIFFTYNTPWLCPASGNSKLYASDASIEPIGQNGQALAANYGLGAGEFFTYAIVNITFATPSLSWSAIDDPNGLQQLDPANPLTLCDQSVKGGGRFETRPGSGYVYTDNVALKGNVAVPVGEATIVLKFPKVPYLPWQQLQPFINTINAVSIAGCAKGTLLFETFDSQFTATTQGIAGQMLVLELRWQPFDWNTLVRPDTGARDAVYQKGSAGDTTKQFFTYTNFLTALPQYVEAG